MGPEPSKRPPVRILLVDDHPAVRQGLALLLAPEGVCVCAEASDRAEALASLERCRPDLALVDLSLANGEDGLTLVSRLRAMAVPALVYSMYEDGDHVEQALAAGAIGYVAKREIHRVLVEAIQESAAGRRFISPIAAMALTDRSAKTQEQTEDRSLSRKEWHVFRLLGEGEGTIEIADALQISTRTVDSYYRRIQSKLGVTGMRDLRRLAISDARREDPQG